MSTSIDYFDYIRISIASPERILKWSYGEVTKPETIKRRSYKAGNNQLQNIKARKRRFVLRTYLRTYKGLGMFLR